MVDVSAKKIIGKPQSKDLDPTTTGYVLRVDDVLGSWIFPGIPGKIIGATSRKNF